MKNFLNVLFLNILAISLISLCACSDNDRVIPLFPEIEENMVDLTDGMNVKIIDLKDNEASFNIPLATKRDVSWEILKDISSEVPISFHLETGNDNLKILVFDGIEHDKFDFSRPQVFHIRLSVDQSQVTKDIQVILREDQESDLPEYSKKFIGYGMSPFDYLSTVRVPILNMNILNNEIIYEDRSEDPSGINQFEYGGVRYSELMKKLAERTGLKGEALFPGVFDSTKFGYIPVQVDSVLNYQTYIGYHGITMSSVYIKEETLSSSFDSGTMAQYLTTEANDILNNSNTEAYKQFSNDYEGISSLLDQMGAFVITNGEFGGSYMFKFARKENAYYDHIGVDASVYLRKASPEGNSEKYLADYVDYMKTTYMDDSEYQASEGYVNYYNSRNPTYQDNYKGTSFMFGQIDISGVDKNKITKFNIYNRTFRGVEYRDTVYSFSSWEEELRSNNKNWTLIHYNYGDRGNYKKSNGLIPIYQFVTDNERRKAIEENFATYLNNSVKVRDEHHLVVADFYMEAVWDDNVTPTNHRTIPPILKTQRSPITGLTIPRIILGANSNAPERNNYAIETNSDKYIVCTTEQYHYWYYALGYHEDGEGFTNIRFDNSELKGGWIKRGDHADTGTGGVALDNNVIWIKSPDANTTCEEKVKSVALSLDKDSKQHYGTRIIASTIPGEMAYNQDVATDSFMSTSFYKYWDTNNARPYDDTHFYEGGAVFYNRFKVVANWNEYPENKLSREWGESSMGHPANRSANRTEWPYFLPILNQ